MMMHHPITPRSHLLAGAAALAMLTVASPALAQLPSGGTIVVGNVTRQGGGGANNGGGPGASLTNSGGDTFTMNVNQTRNIIDWTNFDIGEGNTVRFNNSIGGNPAFAVLNRVSGNATQIEGTLRAESNNANGGSIWVINPNGVVFGPNSSVTNMAGFVAGTLPLDDDAITEFGTNGPFAAGLRYAGTGGAITVQNGANINIGGPILMVSPRITVASGASVTANAAGANDGDVAFVVAQDATVQLSATSLISVNIAAGTSVGADALLVAGTVQGQRVFGVVANATTTLATLLNVSGTITATDVLATANGIVLRAGSDGNGITVSDPQNGGGRIAVTGTLAASTSSVIVAGNAAVTAGAVTAGGNISISGTSVALNANLTADRAIGVTATDGAITSAAVTLRSNADNEDFGAGGVARGITLAATQGIGTQSSAPALITAEDPRAGKLDNVSVTAGNGTDVNLGTIEARALTIDAVTAGEAGNVRLGNLITAAAIAFNVNGDLVIGNIDNSAGTVTLTGRSVTVNDAGTLTVASVTADNGAVSLTAANALTLGGNITATGGNATLQGAGVAIGGTTVSATGAVAITATGATAITATGGATVTANSDNSGGGTLALTAGGNIGAAANVLTLNAGNAAGAGNADSITVTPGDNGSVFLGPVTGGSLTIQPGAGNGIAAITTGTVQSFAGDIALEADAITVAGNSLTAARNLSFIRTDNSAIDLSGTTLIATTGNLTIRNTGGDITLGAAANYGFANDLTIDAGAANQVIATANLVYTGRNLISVTGELQTSGILTLAANTITLGAVTGQAGSGNISLSATNGPLTVGNAVTDLAAPSTATLTLSSVGTGAGISTSGATQFRAAGAVDITGTVSINNGLTVAGTAVTMGNVSTRATGSNAGTGDVSITAATGNVGAGSVASRGGVTVAANTAAATVTLGGADSQQGVLVTAGGAATISGAVTTRNSRDYIVRAASVTAGAGGTVNQTAAGGLLLQANSGNVTLLGTLALTAAGGNNLVIDAGGNSIIGTAATSLTSNNGGAVLLLRDTATALTLGDVTAGSFAAGLRIAPGLTPANYAAVPAATFSAGADLTLGRINIGSPIDIVATAGNIVLNGAASTGTISIAANTGTLTIGRLDQADAVTSTGGGTITLTAGGGDALIRAGITAGAGAIDISSNRDVVLGRNAGVVQSGGTINVSGPRRITGVGGIELRSSAPLGIRLSSGTDAPDGARSIGFGNASILNAGTGNLTIGSNALFDGLALGAVTAGSLTANGTLATPGVVPGAVDAFSLTIANGFTLRSGGALAVGAARSSAANGSISLISGSTLVLGEAVLSGATSALTLRAPQIGGSIVVTTAPTVNAQALAGRGGNLQATGNITLFTPGAITIASSVVTTGDLVTLDAGGNLSVAGGDIGARQRVVALGDNVTIGNVAVNDDIVVVARDGDLTAGTLTVRNIAPGQYVDDILAPLDGQLVPAVVVNPAVVPIAPILPLIGRNVVALANGEIVAASPNIESPDGTATVKAGGVVNLDTVNSPDVDVSGARITATQTVTAGLVRLIATGVAGGPNGIDIRSVQAATSVQMESATDIIVTGTITTTNGPLTLTALSGLARVTGAIGVGGSNDLIIRAGSIELASTATAGGGLLLQSITAGMALAGPLQSGTGPLVLDAATAITGAPDLIAGPDGARTAALLRQRAAGTALELGDVTAGSLATTATAFSTVLLPGGYAAAVPNTLTNAAAITLGAVSVTNDLLITSTGASISIASAASTGGRMALDAGLDLLIGDVGEARAFASAGTGMILRAQRSILGSGTLTLSAPAVTLEAGAIAPVFAAAAPQSGLRSISLGGATITTPGTTRVVARSANFEGLTLGNVDAGLIDVRTAGAVAEGVRGPIVTRVLRSVNSLDLVSTSGDVSVVQASVTGANQALTVRSAGNLAIGATSAPADILLAANGGQLSVSGSANAGQELRLEAAGAVVTQGQLTAGFDHNLVVTAGGIASLRWVSDNPAQQSGAGRDVLVTGTSVEVRQIGAVRDIVLTATAGDVLVPQFTGIAAAGSRRELNGNVRLGTETPIGPAMQFPIDPRVPTDPPNSLDPINPGPIYIGIPTPPPPGFVPPVTLDCGAANCFLNGGVIDLADIVGAGSLTINADDITARDVLFGANITMFSRADIDLRRAIAGGGLDLEAVRSITVSRDSRGAQLAMLARNEDITLGAELGDDTASARSAAGTLFLDAGRNLRAFTVIDGAADVALLGGQATRLGNTSDVQLANVTAGGALQIEGRRGVTAGALAAADGANVRTLVDAQIVDGNITTGTIQAGAISAAANNGRLDVGVLTATRTPGNALRDGSISLTATRQDTDFGTGTAGDIGLAGVAAGSGLVVNAGRDITLNGAIAMTGNAGLTAARTVLANQLIGLDRGSLTVLANRGNVTLGNVTARNIQAAATRGTLLTGALTAGNLVSGTLEGGEIRLTATRAADDSGAEGDVTADGITQANLLVMTAGRDIVLTQPITMTGNATLAAAEDITAGSIALGNAGNLTATTTAGNITLGSVSGNDITAAATNGALDLGRIDGAAIRLTATRDAGASAGSAQGDIGIAADAGLSIGRASSISIDGDRMVTTVGALVSTGAVTAAAGTDLVIGRDLAATERAIGPGGDITLTADSNVLVNGFISAAGRLVAIGANNVATAAISAGRIDIDGRSTVVTGTLSAGAIDVQALTGLIDIADIADSGTVLVQALGDLTVRGNVGTTGAVILRAGQIGTTPGTGSGNLSVGRIGSGSGDITLLANKGRIAANRLDGGVMTLTAIRDAQAGAASTQGDITLAATDALSVGASSSVTLRADRDIDSDGGIVAAGLVDLQAGRTLTAGETLAGDALAISAGSVLAQALGDATLGNVATSGGAVTVRAGQIGATPGSGSGNLVAGNVTTGSGAITLLANQGTVTTGALSGGAVALTATGPAGNVSLAQVRQASSLTVRAGNNITANSDIDITGSIDLDAAQAIALMGVVNAASLIGNAGTTLMATGNIDVRGAVQLTAGTGLDVLNVNSREGGAITLAATSNRLKTGAISGGVVKLDAIAGNAEIGSITRASDLAVKTGTALEIGAIGILGPAALEAGTNLTMAGISSAAALDARAGQAILANGGISVAGAATLRAGGGLTTQDVTSTGGSAITALATTGNARLGTLAGGAIDVQALAGTLTVAGIGASTSVLAQAIGNTMLGTVTSSGAVTARAGQIGTAAGQGSGALAVGAITAGNGAIGLRANNGAVTASGALAGSGVTVEASGTAGDVTLAGISRATTVVVDAGRALTNSAAITATGAVTLRAAAAIDQQGALGTTGRVAATGASVKVANVNSGAGNDIALTASTGSVQTGVLTGGAVTLTSTAANVAIGGVADATSLTVQAATAVVGGGAITVRGNASVTANRVDLFDGAASTLNVGSNALLIRSNAVPDGNVNLALGTDGTATNLFDAGDMARVTAGSVQFDTGARNIVIGTANLFPTGGNVGIRTTGDIDVNGVLTFTSGRTLTLGGDALLASGAAASGADGLATQARNIVVLSREDAAGAGQIVATGSTVRLNGRQVIVGIAAGFRDTLIANRAAPATADVVRGSFTENPISTFYQARPNINPNRFPTLRATNLILRVQNWGLVQNTDTSAQPGGGVQLDGVRLFAATGGPQGGPVIGFFGSLGGQEGIAAALRLSVTDLGGITPNNVRINGCVALTTAGCIVTGLPLPLVQLNDPGRALLIQNVPDLILPLDLISGTTNEALWRDDEELAPSVPARDPGANPPRAGDGRP